MTECGCEPMEYGNGPDNSACRVHGKTPMDERRERYAAAMHELLFPKPRYGIPGKTPGSLPLTATPEEARQHKAGKFADAAMAVADAELAAQNEGLQQNLMAWRLRVGEAEATIARVCGVLDDYRDDPYAQFISSDVRAALRGGPRG